MKLKRSTLLSVLSLAMIVMLAPSGLVSAENSPGPLSSPIPAEKPAGIEVEPEAFSYQFYYFFASGSTLHPADSSVGSNYNPGACVNATGAANDFFTLYMHLPQGSRIDYVRIYYKDTSSSNSRALLRKYDGVGGTTTIGEVSSSGNGGFGSRLSPYLGHVVDNSTGSYVLNWQANVTGSSMQLCGLRVAYRVPVRQVFLPLITKG